MRLYTHRLVDIRWYSVVAIFAITLLSGLLTNNTVCAQPSKKLLVLPFKAYDIDGVSAQNLTNILRRELARRGKYTVLDTDPATDPACSDVKCAVSEGVAADADRAVYGDFSRLGRKILWTYTLVDVHRGEKIFTGDVTEWNVEDLEKAVTEVAHNIENGSMGARPVSIDNSARGPRNRDLDTLVIGVGFGQMYTTNGYVTNDRFGGSDTLERAFILDSRASLQRSNYSLDLLVGIRQGLLINLGASYLPWNAPIAPYIGGGIGYHAIIKDAFVEEDVFISGFQLMARGGVWLLNHSSIRAFINVDYSYTFNSRDDQAVAITLGIAGVTDDIDL